MKLQTPLQVFTDVPPAKVLSRCASCKSNDVFDFDGDLFCNPCGWNSIDSRVENQFAIMKSTHRKKIANAALKPAPSVEEKTASAISHDKINFEANVA